MYTCTTHRQHRLTSLPHQPCRSNDDLYTYLTATNQWPSIDPWDADNTVVSIKNLVLGDDDQMCRDRFDAVCEYPARCCR